MNEFDIEEIKKCQEVHGPCMFCQETGCIYSRGVEPFEYDEEEIHPNCTVQIWKNSKTGEYSIGWWENE